MLTDVKLVEQVEGGNDTSAGASYTGHRTAGLNASDIAEALGVFTNFI